MKSDMGPTSPWYLSFLCISGYVPFSLLSLGPKHLLSAYALLICLSFSVYVPPIKAPKHGVYLLGSWQQVSVALTNKSRALLGATHTCHTYVHTDTHVHAHTCIRTPSCMKPPRSLCAFTGTISCPKNVQNPFYSNPTFKNNFLGSSH